MASTTGAPTTTDVYSVLQSIDSSLRLLVSHLGAGARPVAGQQAATGTVAPDHVLDGQYGDPLVKKKDPKDWTGGSMKDHKFSECPAEYLEMLAEREDYFHGLNQEKLADESDPDEQKKLRESMKYNQRDASRARGWAARKRAGWQPPAPEPSAFGTPASGDELTADNIPF